MDLFSHGLWTWVIYKFINERRNKTFNPFFAAFWGFFPDLFAFIVPYVWLFWQSLEGKIPFSDLPRPDQIEPVSENLLPASQLASSLYDTGHSLIIFFLTFGIIAGSILFNRRFKISAKLTRVPWEMGGWLGHILMDIPTHSLGFYSTPFLWPLSNYRVDGISWSTPWFLVLDYSLIVIVYYALLRAKKIRITWPRFLSNAIDRLI